MSAGNFRVRASGVALVAATVAVVVVCSQPAQPKVVFLQGSSVVVANAAGTDVRPLVTDQQEKLDPKWSPLGNRIVYRTAASSVGHPRKHANLVVIDGDGRRLATVDVLSSEPDGTIVGGMRFVESSGWHAQDLVFAAGSVGPRAIEYRVMDLSGRVDVSYFGTAFATCPAQGRVAYVVDADEPSRRLAVEIDGVRVHAFDRPDVRVARLQWTAACDRLAIVEVTDVAASLLVLKDRAVEARLPLLPNATEVAVVADLNTFLVGSAGQPLQYDPAARALAASPTAWRDAEAKHAERTEVVKKLGGESADWWIPLAK